MNLSPTQEDNFWSKVSIPRDVMSGCWTWIANSVKGRGRISVNNKDVLAPRLAWELTRGPIPNGLLVRHVKCRNPACVNPMHLEVGTHAENSADMMRDIAAEGRVHHLSSRGSRRAIGSFAGSRHWKSILSEEDVREILLRLARGQSQASIARLYGVGHNAVHKIKTGAGWKHVRRATETT